MNPIHIQKTTIKSAVSAIADVMRRAPSVTWTVRTVSAEGYEIAPSNSRGAKAWRKWFPESVAGDFTRADLQRMPMAMLRARYISELETPNASDERRAWRRESRCKQRAQAVRA